MTKKRQLLYYMNGEEVGVAATGIPDTVFGFVDLRGWISVKLIPDVQEVRR